MPFDQKEFERTIQAKVEARPELGAPLAAVGAGTVIVAVLGLAILVRTWRRRAAGPEAPGPPVAPRWGPLDVGVLATGFVFLAVIAGTARAAADPDGGLLSLLGASQAVSVAAAALAALIVAARGHRPVARALGLAAPAPGSEPAPVAGARFWARAFPLCYGAGLLARAAFERLGWDRTPNPAAEGFVTTGSPLEIGAVVAVAILLAPPLEEIVHRGFVFPALRARLGRRAGIAVSAALFAAIHPAPDMLPIFILGCALALAYESTGSLWAPIAAHALNNALSLLSLAAQRHAYLAAAQ